MQRGLARDVPRLSFDHYIVRSLPACQGILLCNTTAPFIHRSRTEPQALA